MISIKTVFLLLGSSISIAQADMAVIVNPGSKVNIAPDQIRNIFLAKLGSFPDGSPAKPVDQSEESAIRHDFYSKFVGKDDSDMKVYWANLIFSGNGRPPKAVGEDNDVKKYVKDTPGGIGYIDSKSVDSTVKVIYSIK